MNANSLITVDTWIVEATNQLKDNGILTARLDGLVLLENVLGKDRSWLLAHPEKAISKLELKKLNEYLQLRITHLPIAYITNKSEFYGREFIINGSVLEPRPETEAIFQALEDIPLSSGTTIADIGTGSGAIAITAKLEHSKCTVAACDISPSALKVARRNAKRLSANIEFIEGDLFSPFVSRKFDIVLANLPYVPDSFPINQAAKHEPALALFGGEDGLNLYRTLFTQLSQHQHPPQYVITESLPIQHNDLVEIASNNHYSLQATYDFVQLFSLNK